MNSYDERNEEVDKGAKPTNKYQNIKKDHSFIPPKTKYKVVLVAPSYLLVDINGFNQIVKGVFSDVKAGDKIDIDI